MTITPALFEAFLKCPTKCWLRATGETPSGNIYAEWVQSQNESFRASETERLLAETPPGESARSPTPENLKASKWRLAVDIVARTPDPPCSSRREEAPSSVPQPQVRVSQTCKYMGVDFLDFLRSGEKDVHAFAESRRGRRR